MPKLVGHCVSPTLKAQVLTAHVACNAHMRQCGPHADQDVPLLRGPPLQMPECSCTAAKSLEMGVRTVIQVVGAFPQAKGSALPIGPRHNRHAVLTENLTYSWGDEFKGVPQRYAHERCGWRQQ
jgi:hypothetical protein